MDKFTGEIMTLLKNKFTESAGEKVFQDKSEMLGFYLKKLDDNFYRPMDANALKAYDEGSGSEIKSGKMNALRSSSALTYNLFWDQIAELNHPGESSLGTGVYKVEFEKKLHPLKISFGGNPANLDAFLYCKHTNEAIACEMKMMEWIFNQPGELKAKYLDENNYIDEEAGKVFVPIANKLIETGYARYDAFQMFKHAVACYSAISGEEPRKIKKLTLVNCVWCLSDPEQLSEKTRERYLRYKSCEDSEFGQFKEAMEPVKALFLKKDVVFDIKYFSFNDFLALFEKTEDEKKYLKRYTMD